MKPGSHTCPTSKVAELLSDTWTMLIVHELLGGPKRFCELERDLSGISTRTLTNKLRELDTEGIVEKNIQGRYRITSKGRGLRPILNAMRAYGEKFL